MCFPSEVARSYAPQGQVRSIKRGNAGSAVRASRAPPARSEHATPHAASARARLTAAPRCRPSTYAFLFTFFFHADFFRAAQTLVSVSTIGTLEQLPEEQLVAQVKRELGAWFGDAEVAGWRHLKTYRIPFAQPSQVGAGRGGGSMGKEVQGEGLRRRPSGPGRWWSAPSPPPP